MMEIITSSSIKVNAECSLFLTILSSSKGNSISVNVWNLRLEPLIRQKVWGNMLGLMIGHHRLATTSLVRSVSTSADFL